MTQLLDKVFAIDRRDEHPRPPLAPDDQTVERERIGRDRHHRRLYGLYLLDGDSFLREDAAMRNQHPVSRDTIIGVEKDMQHQQGS